MSTCKYYFKSHINEPLVTGRTNTNSENFNIQANNHVSNIHEYPHAFVLACLMDTVVDADVAWSIPYRVLENLGTLNIHKLYKVSSEQYIEVFDGDKNGIGIPHKMLLFL